MNGTTEDSINVLLIITGFVSDNMVWIFCFAFLYLCRKAISDLITRLTDFSYSKGNAKVGIAAAPPISKESTTTESSTEKYIRPESIQPEKPTVDLNSNGTTNGFESIGELLIKGELDRASKVFKAYEVEESDADELFKRKAQYFYMRFQLASDIDAIASLEEHIVSANNDNESLIFEAISKLSFCLVESSQLGKDIALWSDSITNFTKDEIRNDVIINLAYAYRLNGDYELAKKTLVEQLPIVKNDRQRSSLYIALGLVEDDLGNKDNGTYCRDKAVECDPTNLSTLFDSAYSASNSDANEIAISNYITLTNIDPKNAIAKNNLGVALKNSGLKVTAVRHYIEASQLKETLSMVNQGFLLLEAGFVDKAEDIAKEALEYKDVHENVYNLMAKINEEKKRESEKYKSFVSKSSDRQLLIRNYTDKLYTGSPEQLAGSWVTENGEPVKIVIGESIIITWETVGSISSGRANHEITAEPNGSTFKGLYKLVTEDSKQTLITIFNQNINAECLGFLDENCIHILSKQMQDDVSISLYRK